VAERDLHSNEPATPDGLTLKQTLFVEAYLGEAHGNGVQAARIAGYTGSSVTLRQTASQLLRHPHVSSRIRARVAEVCADTTAILLELWQVASAPTAACMTVTRPATFDVDGNLVEPMRARLDYSSKVKAIELLLRYNGLLNGKAQTEPVVKALVGVDIGRI
jgi:hypothetical protein